MSEQEAASPVGTLVQQEAAAVGRWVPATAARKLLLRRVAVVHQAVTRGDAAGGEESERRCHAAHGADRRGRIVRCWGRGGTVHQI
jgi:hypothetical protein